MCIINFFTTVLFYISGATYPHDGHCTGLRKRSAVGQQPTIEPRIRQRLQ
jgi:hypothetical protein